MERGYNGIYKERSTILPGKDPTLNKEKYRIPLYIVCYILLKKNNRYLARFKQVAVSFNPCCATMLNMNCMKLLQITVTNVISGKIIMGIPVAHEIAQKDQAGKMSTFCKENPYQISLFSL